MLNDTVNFKCWRLMTSKVEQVSAGDWSQWTITYTTVRHWILVCSRLDSCVSDRRVSHLWNVVASLALLVNGVLTSTAFIALGVLLNCRAVSEYAQ